LVLTIVCIRLTNARKRDDKKRTVANEAAGMLAALFDLPPILI
jgi:hypothetical protein